MVRLSVLGLAPITHGSDAAAALRNTLDLARHAERLGFHRYWLAEHHNMPGIASAAILPFGGVPLEEVTSIAMVGSPATVLDGCREVTEGAFIGRQRFLPPRQLADLGLMGVQFPEEYGGAGMTALNYCICIEELARVCPSVALSVAAHNGLCAAHIYRFGTVEQRQRFLAPLARGKKIGAWALTEASSGSDATTMRTTATLAGSSWVINGSKVFTTHGRVGDTVVVLAVTDRTAGRRGISAFVVDKGTPGMKPGKKENKLGMRASDTSELIFQDCRVPADHLIGKAGHGFIDAMQILDTGRIGIAALAVGLAQGAHEAAIKYALQRNAFGHSIAIFQAIQWKLADNATNIDAGRLLTYRAASRHDGGRSITSESAMAKLFASETAVKVADDCVQIHGGYGFVKDYPAEKYFRDVKLTTIGEGTSEIQRIVIARQLLRDYIPKAEMTTATAS